MTLIRPSLLWLMWVGMLERFPAITTHGGRDLPLHQLTASNRRKERYAVYAAPVPDSRAIPDLFFRQRREMHMRKGEA